MDNIIPKIRAFLFEIYARRERTVVGAVHDLINIAVVPHVKYGAAADGEDEARNHADHGCPMGHRAARTHEIRQYR